MKVKFKRWTGEIVQSNYQNNNRIALSLVDIHDGSCIAIATVNVITERLAENEVIIKDYSENEGMYQALLDAGVIGKAKRYVYLGTTKNPVCDLLINNVVDNQTKVLKAVMERYEGLVPLKMAMNEDEDVVLVNLSDDLNDELSENEILKIIYKLLS